MATITEVKTELAPKAIGPYSQAIRAGHFLYVSGQIPLDPQTGQLVENSIETQTIQVLNNLTAILAEAGLTLNHVVKTEVFLKDLNDFKKMNEIYSQKFTLDPKPARQAIQAARLPMDALVEISCIAYFSE